MAGTVDALNVRIGADISNLQKNLKKCASQLTSLQGTTQKVSDKMKSSFDGISNTALKVGKTIAAAFAVNKIVDFGKSCIDAGSDLTEVQNVVDTVFGSMSENINTWSKNAMSAFGLSETAAKQYTSTMGAMLKSSGITGSALETMSINMASLSADMASFYNLDTDTAFNKIRAGISGETEPLKQLGINMSVANMEAYALSQGITKSYDSMTQAEQSILRYNYLLSVTADAQHDFERTSTSWANQVRVLSENFNKLKTIIGQGLIQALTPIINIFNALISKVIEFAQTIAAAFGVSDDTGSGGLSDTASDAANTASGLEDANTAAKNLKSTISGFDELNILSDSSGTDDVSSALAGLTPNSVYDSLSSGVSGLSKQMEEFAEKLKTKLQPVVELAKDIKDSFTEAFDSEMCDALIADLKTGLLTVTDIIGTFAEKFDNAWNNKGAGTKLLESVGNALDNILGLANEVGQSIADALSSDAGTAWIESLIDKWQSFVNLIDGITTGLRAAWNDKMGEQYIESILEKWAAVNEFLSTIRNTIGQMFASEVGQEFFAQIISLVTQWNDNVAMVFNTFTEVWDGAELGQSIIEGIVQTVTNLIGWVTDMGEHFAEAWENNELGQQTVEAIGEAVKAVVELVEQLSSKWRSVWNNDTTTAIFEGILSIIKTIAETVENVADNIKQAFSSTNVDTKCFEAVRNSIESIVSAAQNLASNLGNALSGIDWNPIADAAGKLATAISDVVKAVANLASGILSEFGSALAKAFNDEMPRIINAVAVALQIVANILNALTPETVVRLVEAFVALQAASTLISIFNSLKGAFNGVINVLTNVNVGFTQTTATILVIVTALAALATAIAAVINAWNDLSNGTSSASTALSSATSSMTVQSVSYSALSSSDIPQAATGGVFDKGDLFIANEQGPELVGASNGQSVVMNNEQIVDAVSSGVADAMQPLVDAMQGGNSEQTVKIRGTDLLYVLTKTQKQRGSVISNNFAFGGA